LSNDAISNELKLFIDKHISSVAQMEVLLLLCRLRERTWNATEVATALYIQPASAANYLADLAGVGCCLLQDDTVTRYQFNLQDAHQGKLIRELTEAYKTRPVAVITRIFSKPPDHVRLFSDAFKLRKDD
jgi:hypothetical protein